MPSTVSRLPWIPVLGALLCLAAAPVANAAGADDAVEPEHVSAAFTALGHGNVARARHQLRDAIDNRNEPAAARRHARRALSAVRHHHLRSARHDARGGAVAEHLTYARNALADDNSEQATEHLQKAEHLAPGDDDVQRALHALEAGDDNGAGAAIDDDLARVGGDG